LKIGRGSVDDRERRRDDGRLQALEPTDDLERADAIFMKREERAEVSAAVLTTTQSERPVHVPLHRRGI
jgi:hypothetical protein